MSEITGPGGASLDLPPPMMIAEHPGLDFLNTVASPRGVRTEWIGDGAHFLDWLDIAGLVSKADALGRFEAMDFDETAARARWLREEVRPALFEESESRLSPKTARHFKFLNEIMATESRFSELTFHEGHFEMVSRFRWTHPNEVLLPIADAISDLFCHGDFSLVRKCENPKCTLWFYDRTKSHRRRWCTTTICGNQAKVAAHRARQRDKSSS